MAKVRTRNFKVVSEVVLGDGSVVPNVGGNVRYFAHHNRAVNYADLRSGNVRTRKEHRGDRTVAITVYHDTNKDGKHDVMKYRTW